MKPVEITLGYSPCPNDTYIFRALSRGDIQLPGYTVRTELMDVESLNQAAMNREFDVTKLSFYAWLMVAAHYRLLDVGTAMGYGCGPVVVSRRPVALSDLPDCRVALPGKWTTAHLLFRLWEPRAAQRVFTTYDQVLPMVETGRADCAVIIHETRFTYAQAGFRTVVDLGQWWQQETGLPIPLGCIAAKKSLPEAVVEQVAAAIGQSLRAAHADPQACLSYMQENAREMETEVLWRHVHTFVNDFSLSLGESGQRAIETLAQRARSAGVLP